MYTNINTVLVSAGADNLDTVSQLLAKGIAAVQEAQSVLATGWISDQRSREAATAVNDWNEFVPGFKQDVDGMVSFLRNVVTTYNRLDHV